MTQVRGGTGDINMSLFYKSEKKVSDSGEEYASKKMRSWVKWVAYIGSAAMIGVAINHYTGDKTGLEQMITGKPAGKLEEKASIKPNINYLKSELLKQKLYLVMLEWNGKEILAAAQPTTPVITDGSYTSIEKFYFIDIKEFPNIKLVEPDEAFIKDLEAGKVNVVLGYATSSTKSTQQSGTNPLQSFQRILR